MSDRLLATLAVLCATSVLAAHSLPKPEPHKTSDDRIKETARLSDEEHDLENGDHNPDYDHEAFLGEQDAQRFNDMERDDAVEALSIIFDKIDKDQDGKLTQDELSEWIRYVQNKYIRDDVDAQWKTLPLQDGEIQWDIHVKSHYGAFLNDKDSANDADDGDDDDDDDDEGTYDYKKAMETDRRRWNMADEDKNGNLNLKEFTNFLHPEDAPHMQDIVVQETMEDIDSDGDGRLTLEEYVADIWSPDEEDKKAGEPDWVKTEREHFSLFRDKNHDGFMDMSEVKNWIMPDGYDHVNAEAKHLMFQADEDKDEFLTRDEVMEKYDVFVGSQATDFGEALLKHEEF